jgi:hypothetical protein
MSPLMVITISFHYWFPKYS